MARILEALIGHRDRMEPLLTAHEKGRLASALLFAGPAGVGKKFAARGLAQVLVCERGNPRAACGECGPCVRIEKGQSEDLLEIAPEGSQIKVEQIRDVIKFISLQKLGRARVVIIDEAHLMGPQAANALLKSLEEPPPGTYFILVTASAGAMLATIRSRTQLVRFSPLEKEELAKILGPSADPWVIESAHGSVETAERLSASREEFEELERAIVEYLTVARARLPLDEAAKLKTLTKDRTAQAFVTTWLGNLVRDALRVQAGLSPLSGPFWEQTAPAFLNLSSARLFELADASLQLEADLARNIDRGLAFENFALLLREGEA